MIQLFLCMALPCANRCAKSLVAMLTTQICQGQFGEIFGGTTFGNPSPGPSEGLTGAAFARLPCKILSPYGLKAIILIIKELDLIRGLCEHRLRPDDDLLSEFRGQGQRSQSGVRKTCDRFAVALSSSEIATTLITPKRAQQLPVDDRPKSSNWG